MPEIITQKVHINAIPKDIFKEILNWSESTWWPNGPMKIVNTSGKIEVGTCYNYSVEMFMGPSWQAVNRMVDKDNLYLRRDFFGGDVDGFEEATIITDENGYCEVTYTFAAEIPGKLNRFIWNQFGKAAHRENIDNILRALKSYMERKR